MKRAAPVLLLLVALLGGALWFAASGDTALPGQGAPEPADLLAPSSGTVEASRLARGRVAGRVFRGGVGVPRAVVTVKGLGPLLTASTLDDGAFLFEGVLAGEFFVSASDPAGASDVLGPLVLSPAGEVGGLVLELAPAVSLEGRVVNALTRAPLEGALVVAPSGSVRTGPTGAFTLRGAVGQAWVEGSAVGFLPRMEWVSIDRARAGGRFELALAPVSSLSGTVLEGGLPVARASVWVEVTAGSRRGERSRMVLTDAQGKFELECADGLLIPQAATPRGTRLRGTELRLGVGEHRDGVVLEAGDVSGVDGVVTRDGQPLPGASLSIVEAGGEQVVAAALTGPSGRFSVSALQAGRYVVQVGVSGFHAIAGPFVHRGDGVPWTVAVRTGGVLEGEVRPPGAGVLVRLRTGDWSGPPPITGTDANGRFRFEGVPEGSLGVDAEGPLGTATARARAGDHVVLDLSRGAVVVRVVDASGAPVSDALLLARSTSTGVVRRQLVIAPDGMSRLELPPGTWVLVAEATGRGRSPPRRVEVSAGDQTVELALGDTLTVRGAVRDSNTRQPVAGAQVVAVDYGDVNQHRVAVLSDAQGEFVLSAVSPGSGALVRKAGYRPGWRLVREAGGTGRLDVDIAPDPKNAHREDEAPSFEGVGMVLAPQDGRVLVTAVNEGSPAERAGVQRGDVITSVDGVPAVLPLDGVVARIRGPAGSPVTIVFERAGQSVVLILRRKLLHY